MIPPFEVPHYIRRKKTENIAPLRKKISVISFSTYNLVQSVYKDTHKYFFESEISAAIIQLYR
jgi:hypothetical protein